MAELKYEKYFMKDSGFIPRAEIDRAFGKVQIPKLHHILGINRKRIEGAITMNCSWMDILIDLKQKISRNSLSISSILISYGLNVPLSS